MGGRNKKTESMKVKYEEQTSASLEDISKQDIESDIINNEDSDSERIPVKRHVEDDEGSEPEGRRKKKKKKQIVPDQSTGQKTNKSIRQMKREKHAERLAESEAIAKDQVKSQCISYLSQWKHDRQNWKFMKAKQVWLYKNKFSTQLIPDSSWPTLLEYFESAKGNIRNMLLADATKIIKQMDDWTERQANENEQSEEKSENDEAAIKPDDKVYSRARSLIQCLQE